VDWLEKQGERKSDWSKDDTQYINDILALLSFGCSIHSVGEVQEWLQSLSNRVQPKQEWSEDDEEMFNEIIIDLKALKNRNIGEAGKAAYQREIDWLESLRPQSHWKPSEEQMRVLDLAIRCGINRGTTEETTLVSLFNDLKKLREE
jgi:hypothetical protein